MTLSITPLDISIECYYAECYIFYCYAECRFAECRYAECRWQNVVILSVVAPKYKKFSRFLPKIGVFHTS
jgi:hypothetical protein